MAACILNIPLSQFYLFPITIQKHLTTMILDSQALMTVSPSVVWSLQIRTTKNSTFLSRYESLDGAVSKRATEQHPSSQSNTRTQQSCVSALDAALSPGCLSVRGYNRDHYNGCCSVFRPFLPLQSQTGRPAAAGRTGGVFRWSCLQHNAVSGQVTVGSLDVSPHLSTLRTRAETDAFDTGCHTDLHNVKETRWFLRVWKMITTSADLSIMVRRCLLTFKPFR